MSSRLQMRCSKVGGSGAKEAPPHFSPVKSQMREGSRSLGSVLPSPTPQLSLRSPLSFHPVTKTNKQLPPALFCNISLAFSQLRLYSLGL